MYNTGNAVPSSALEDMADNAQTFDALVTKTEGTTTDRLGRTRRVFQQILMDMGFQPLAGSFQTGATITARNQTLYDESSQVFYSWNGALPKVVPAGSTPATAGGTGVGSWSDKTDLMLRNQLASSGGGNLVLTESSELAAEERTVTSKLHDVQSVLDFYSSSDINHQLAFEKATATGKPTLIPDGNYIVTSDIYGDFYSHGGVKISGGAVSSIIELQRSSPNKLTQLYKRGRAFESGGVYTAWPYGCLFTDTISGVETALLVYTSGSSHVATDRRIYLRKMNTSDGDASMWGNSINIVNISGYVPTGGVVAHAAGKCANGDYIVIAQDRNISQSALNHLVFRSADKGTTWSYTSNVWRGGSGFLITKTGRVISGYGTEGGISYIDTSDDNGATWVRRSVTPLAGTAPLEPSFVQIGSGEIVSIWRRDIDDVFTDKRAYLYSVSSDNGSTWSALADTNFIDANNSPCALVYHTDEGVVEMFSCSRYAMNDGYASMYQSYATDILTGKFSVPERISMGVNTRDFGYPAAVNVAGKVLVAVYNGGNGYTWMQQLWGTRNYKENSSTSPLVVENLVDPYTGFQHAVFNKDTQGMSLRLIDEITHLNQSTTSAINLRGDKNYFGSSIELYNAAPGVSTGTIDVYTPINAVGKWNPRIKGLWLYVEWTVTSTGKFSIQIGNSVFKETITRKNAATTEIGSAILLVPIDFLGTGGITSTLSRTFGAPDGGTIAAYTNVNIRAFGYSV